MASREDAEARSFDALLLTSSGPTRLSSRLRDFARNDSEEEHPLLAVCPQKGSAPFLGRATGVKKQLGQVETWPSWMLSQYLL